MSLASAPSIRMNRSRAAANERQWMRLCPQIPAAAVDEQRVFRGDIFGPEERDRDHPAGRRGPGSARDLADFSGSLRDLVAVDRRDVGVDSQTEELAAHLAH